MIEFHFVRWKNFLSTGNVFTEVDLHLHDTTLITGENGAGKSTILDALCFGLYGKPFRKVKKNQLINSVNNGGTVVEVEFMINGNDYKIVRGIKPNGHIRILIIYTFHAAFYTCSARGYRGLVRYRCVFYYVCITER